MITQNKFKHGRQHMRHPTVSWGVSIDDDIFDNPIIKQFLLNHPAIIPLKKLGTSLLHVGKKYNCHEMLYVPLEGYSCVVHVDAYGYSDDALALRVVKIVTDHENIQSFAIQQHITLALKKGVNEKEAVQTLIGFGTVNNFDGEILLNGFIKRYIF